MKARKPHMLTESAQTGAASSGEQKSRSAQFLVEQQELRGCYGTMFLRSASVRMLSGLMMIQRTATVQEHKKPVAER